MSESDTIDLLAQTSLHHLLFIENIIKLFLQTSYLNEEVNRTEAFPSVSFPSAFYIENITYFCYKQATLMRRSTVQRLSLQLVFPLLFILKTLLTFVTNKLPY